MIAEVVLYGTLALAGATHENDSNSIDLPSSLYVPSAPNQNQQNSDISTSTLQNLFGTSSGATTGTGDGSSSGSGQGVTQNVPPAVQSELQNAAAQTGGIISTNVGGNGSTLNQNESISTPLVTALTSSGAVSIERVSGSGSATLGYGDYVTHITADGVRNVLGAFGISSIDVETWIDAEQTHRSVTAHATLPPNQPISYSPQDLAVIASSLSLGDAHFVDADVSGTHLTLHYKTSGRVLGFIPIILPITIEVQASAIAAAERVILTYPWYRTFTWLTVPESSVRTAIDKKLLEAIQSSVGGADREARLFVAVMSALSDLHAEYEKGIKLVL